MLCNKSSLKMKRNTLKLWQQFVLKYHRFLFVFFLSILEALQYTYINFGISKQIQVFKNCTLASSENLWVTRYAQFHKRESDMIERDGFKNSWKLVIQLLRGKKIMTKYWQKEYANSTSVTQESSLFVIVFFW